VGRAPAGGSSGDRAKDGPSTEHGGGRLARAGRKAEGRLNSSASGRDKQRVRVENLNQSGADTSSGTSGVLFKYVSVSGQSSERFWFIHYMGKGGSKARTHSLSRRILLICGRFHFQVGKVEVGERILSRVYVSAPEGGVGLRVGYPAVRLGFIRRTGGLGHGYAFSAGLGRVKRTAQAVPLRSLWGRFNKEARRRI